VVLPSDIAALLPKGRLLSEVWITALAWLATDCEMLCRPPYQCYVQNEWRGIGVQQSRGWVHYAIHKPEPHIMLFRYWQAEVTVL